MRFVQLIGGLVFVLSFVRLSIQRKERIELTMNYFDCYSMLRFVL